MSDDETQTIEVDSTAMIGKWAHDSFTFRPLYNPDGTRMRQRVRISNADDPEDYEDFEVLEVERT